LGVPLPRLREGRAFRCKSSALQWQGCGLSAAIPNAFFGSDLWNSSTKYISSLNVKPKNPIMKKRILKLSFWLITGFILLFIFRIIYSYAEKDVYDGDDGGFGYFDGSIITRKNYASDSYKFKREEQAVKASIDMVPTDNIKEISVSQKYEKTAMISAKSEEFEKDEKDVKKQIKSYNAIIQYEENRGNKGNRRINLMIGVKPEKFDSFYMVMKRIAHTKSAEITKVDKTSEYKALNAQKISLEKTRQSLIELKKQTGKIDEFVNLENRILEIEGQLQGLGVSLGDFDEENEFCTINFSMYEGKIIKQSFIHRVKVSLEWTITWYYWVVIILLIIGAASFVVLLAAEKLKLLQAIVRKLNS